MSVKKAPTKVGGTRTFGIGAACLGLLLSVPVHALSLGGIQVKSALDEPLRAEITLQSADAQTLESLEISLGTREDFQRADVPRAEFLDQLQFSVSTEGREPVVVVTTEQPVKEPFLHFLISAEWSGGKLVREYTGLLDPPLYATEEPARIETPGAGETVAAEEPAATIEPASEAAGADAGATAADTTGTSMAAASGRSAEYGPTQEGDTLWSIASRLDTGALQVNVFQVMIALLRENPDAFIDNNINRLKTGQVLRLDDVGDVAGVSNQEATEVYTAQLEEWRAYKTQVADAGGGVNVSGETTGDAAMTADADASQAADPADAAQAGDTGQEAGSQSAAEQAGQGTGDDEVLRIVQATVDESQQSEGAGAGTDRSGEIAELQGQIATLEESLESRNLENQELQERVRLLESQLENAQRLIEIESQELAAAQQAAEQAEAEAAEEAARAAERAEAEAAEQAAQAAEEAAQQAAGQGEEESAMADAGEESQAASAESESDANMVSVESASESDNAAAETGSQSEGAQAAAAPAASGDSAAQSGQSQQKVRKVSTRPPEASWWANLPDMLFSSWMWMVGAGVGVLVLVLGLLMFLRRRQSIAEFEESILSGSALDSYSETTDTASSSASDTSFLSDFGTAGMGTMQADEVDPLAEAEVYLAYGRDEQAEEVLKEAARRDPERSEIKLKLLEIYKQRKDVKSFETIAEELYPASEQEDPAIWRQVSVMGRELSPENPLFQGAEDAPSAASAPASEPETPARAPSTVATASRAPAPASEADTVDTFDFDLDDLGGGEPGGPAGAETVEQTSQRNVEALNLDGDMDTDTGSSGGGEPMFGPRADASPDDNTLEFDDDFMERSSKTVDPAEQPFPKPDQQTDLDRELERLAGERERASAPTQVRPAETAGSGDDAPSREVSWETAESDTPTLDFPSSETSELDFDLNLDESSIPSQSGREGTGGEEPELQHGAGEARDSRDAGEGLLEFESENIPPQETWAGPSSDASPGAADDDSLSYSPDDDVQSAGAQPYNEAETKLDLARAYLDMGDKVGARSIIDEVMREGDPSQRDRAAELASQL